MLASSMTEPAPSPFTDPETLPRWEAIAADAIPAAVRAIIDGQDRARDALERAATPTWEGLAAPLSAAAEPLSYAWNVVHHLLSVKNSPALREAQEAVQPEVVAASLRLAQSQALYDAFKALRDGAGAALDPAQRRIVETAIREAELAGVGLAGA